MATVPGVAAGGRLLKAYTCRQWRSGPPDLGGILSLAVIFGGWGGETYRRLGREHLSPKTLQSTEAMAEGVAVDGRSGALADPEYRAALRWALCLLGGEPL